MESLPAIRRMVIRGFAVTFLLFGLMETASQLLRYPEIDAFAEVTELSPRTQYRNRRGFSGLEFASSARVTINRSGFRGREINPQKAGGVIRIVAMGDSTTFGMGMADGQVYPVILEKLLNEKYRGRPRFEVINAGVIGYTTMHGMRLLEDEILPLHPDLVVISYLINDATFVSRLPGDEKHMFDSPPSPLFLFIRNKFIVKSRVINWATSTLAEYRFQKWQEKNRAKVYPKAKQYYSSLYESNLRQLVSAARSRGIRVVLMPAPVQLRFSLYNQDGGSPVPEDDETTRLLIDVVKSGLRDKLTREQESLQRYKLANLYLRARDYANARAEFEESAGLSDPVNDQRGPALLFMEIMRKVALNNKVPIVDAQSIFNRHELANPQPGLFYNPYHAGQLGHRIIAAALADKIAGFYRWAGR